MARIMLVDDSTSIIALLTRFLETDGHQVVAIGENGFEGVALYKDHKPDLTMLDITMPSKDGRSCLKEILEHDPHARVLIVSAIKARPVIMECLTLGAKGYVDKPLQFYDEDFCTELRETIAMALSD